MWNDGLLGCFKGFCAIIVIIDLRLLLTGLAFSRNIRLRANGKLCQRGFSSRREGHGMFLWVGKYEFGGMEAMNSATPRLHSANKKALALQGLPGSLSG